MRTVQKEYKVFKSSELTKDIQEKVLADLSGFNVEHDWWDSIYDDALNIGIKITGFDLDRGSYCKGDYMIAPLEVIAKIKENHGKNCETYKTAIEFEKKFLALGLDEDGYQKEDEVLEDDFRNSLLEDYRIMLQKDFDYLTSKPAVLEMIECNEYEFTQDGKIFR